MPEPDQPSGRALRVFAAGVGVLLLYLLTAPLWRPRLEAAMWARCQAAYAAAHTAAESTLVDHQRPLMPKLHEIDRRTACIDLRRTREPKRAP